MRSKAYPITSKIQLNFILDAIRRIHIEHYLMMKLVLETGVPLKFFYDFYVKDIRKGPFLTYPAYHSASAKTYTEQISDGLYEELLAYTERKSPGDLVFTGKDGKGISPSSLRHTFDIVSRDIGLSQNISVLSFKKTFVFNVLYTRGDMKAAKEYIGVPTSTLVYDYLGIPDPKKTDMTVGSHSAIQELTQTEVLFNTKEQVESYFAKIKLAINHPDQVTNTQASRILSQLRQVSTLIEGFSHEEL